MNATALISAKPYLTNYIIQC